MVHTSLKLKNEEKIEPPQLKILKTNPSDYNTELSWSMFCARSTYFPRMKTICTSKGVNPKQIMELSVQCSKEITTNVSWHFPVEEMYNVSLTELNRPSFPTCLQDVLLVTHWFGGKSEIYLPRLIVH